MLRIFTAFILSLVLGSPAFAQSTAINGTIEGTVKDEQGALLPGVTVTVTNVDTGDQRVVITNESGLYRAPLLSLGTYRVAAELQGFKKFEQQGVSLRAGQTAVIDVTMAVGTLAETVTVTADAPLIDLAKIEQGRTLSEEEIKTLPLTSRNPYNFALLQPGVVGFETNEFGVPRLTANGALLRVNYQVDGSNNTQKDRAGLRQMPMSEVMIREVKVVTSGYAPEFGQTMGLVYNAITPSGTNTFKGQGSYRLQRQSMVAMPFYTAANAAKPPTDVNVYTFDLGGPVVKDKTHFFGGYEHTERDLSGLSVITISPANQALLGLSEPAYQPRGLNTEFAIGKLDHQLSAGNRLSFRYMFFDNFITANVGGGLLSVQRANDFADRQHSTGAQLISSIGATTLNELRVQFATRAQSRVPNTLSGTGPAINIAGVAQFGGPIAAVTDSGFGFTQDVLQVNDNITFLRGNHSFKAGLDVQWVADTRTSAPAALYTFPNAAAYLAARDGANRLGYTSFTQYFGLPNLEYNTSQYGFFVQDDWRVAPDFKILYGVRYDLYTTPEANASAPVASSREFKTVTNNVAPRFGAVWTLGESKRSVVRFNTGLMYDQAINAIYEQALQNDGTNARASATFTPTQAGAPAFPAVLSAGAGAVPNTAWTVDPEFKIARSWQNNVQFEQALGDRYAVSIGASYVKGYDLPVVTNINLINPIGTLADGLPVFSPTVSAATRVDPRFNVINSTQSIGESDYKNMTLQFTRRSFNGIGFDLAYTLGKSEDNAPITNALSVQGDAGRVDPTNLDRDLGPNILDQRHTFSGSIVAMPQFERDGALGAILNDNVFGLAIQLASGIPVNLRSNLELNNDGTASDRPQGAARNSLNLPARKNVDARYSRRFRIQGSMAAEIIAEVKNLFNTVQPSGVNATITTNAQGVPVAPLPTSGDQLTPTGGYEQRQFQLGFKFTF
ncbi:MAG TPA: TonB-dependent receptor [Vicinamibacterales bacterium]|nr:TonB-dependent receptor [Vicinamibacterales bacterium]